MSGIMARRKDQEEKEEQSSAKFCYVIAIDTEDGGVQYETSKFSFESRSKAESAAKRHIKDVDDGHYFVKAFNVLELSAWESSIEV